LGGYLSILKFANMNIGDKLEGPVYDTPDVDDTDNLIK
jgi:hypothetical protein